MDLAVTTEHIQIFRLGYVIIRAIGESWEEGLCGGEEGQWSNPGLECDRGSFEEGAGVVTLDRSVFCECVLLLFFCSWNGDGR